MPKCVVFDFDGVLASDKTIRKFADSKNYKAFNKACGNERPNPVTVQMAKNFYKAGYEVRVHTARKYEVYRKTKLWLKRNGLGFAILIMRFDFDNRAAWRVKKGMVSFFKPDLVFEDDEKCVKMYQKLKINVVKLHYCK